MFGGDEEELHQIFTKPLSPLGNAGGQTASNQAYWTTNLDHLNIPKQGPRAGVLTTAKRQDPAMSSAGNRLRVDRKVLERCAGSEDLSLASTQHELGMN